MDQRLCVHSNGPRYCTICADTDDGAVDSYGDLCELYGYDDGWCDGHDGFDFTLSDMRCACGGGGALVPTPAQGSVGTNSTFAGTTHEECEDNDAALVELFVFCDYTEQFPSTFGLCATGCGDAALVGWCSHQDMRQTCCATCEV